MTVDPGEIEARAAARRRDGTYPSGVDDTLRDDVASRISAVSTHTTALRAAVAQVRALGSFEIPRYHGDSRIRSLYDRMVRTAVGYALADLVRQLEAHRAGVDRVLDEVVAEFDDTVADDPPSADR